MLTVKIKGDGIAKLGAAMEVVASDAMKKAYARALNDTGKATRKKTVAAVAKQVGLAQKVVSKRGGIATQIAYGNRLSYVIRSNGGYLLLKDFKPAQFKKGVKASPWGPRRLYEGAFINKGVFGNVMHRYGRPRLIKSGLYKGQIRQPIENMYGPAIPKEIIQGAAKAAFQATSAEVLPKRLAHHIKRATKGVVS